MEIPEKHTFIQKISDDGHFGEVFLCENKYLSSRQEAVKFIETKSKDDMGRMKELEENLFEASVLEYLKKCPYIVNIYDAAILKNGFRINMEYLKNGCTQGLLRKHDFLGIKQVIKISECVLHALEHAHDRNILHLDIKPGNVLIKNKNVYKLSDFGLANIKSEDGTSFFKKIYSSNYPPEKLSGKNGKATVQSDIYMFGVTIYRLLNGESYFARQLNDMINRNVMEKAIILGKFPNRKEYLPHVNKKLKKIVNKCLNVDLNKRYKSAREIRNDLGKIKVKCVWIAKGISCDMECWECFVDGVQTLELIAEKSDGLWEILLYKYGKSKKRKVLKHCSSENKRANFMKKMGIIFNEYC